MKFRFLLYAFVLLGFGCVETQKMNLVPIYVYASKPSIINIIFQVQDNHNNPIPNIPVDKFAIYEDGIRLNDKSIFKELESADKMPFIHKTIIAIDVSNQLSQNKKERIATSLKKLIENGTIRINNQNLIMIVIFSEDIYLVQNWSRDKKQVLKSLLKILYSQSGKTTEIKTVIPRLKSIFRKRKSKFEDNSIILITQEELELNSQNHLYTVLNDSTLDEVLKQKFQKVNNYRDSIYSLKYLSHKRRNNQGTNNHIVAVKFIGDGESNVLKAEFSSLKFTKAKPFIQITSSKQGENGKEILLKAKSVWVNKQPQFDWQLLDTHLANLTINQNDTSQAILSFEKDVVGKTELIIRDRVNKLETSYPILLGIYRNQLFNFENGEIPDDFENIGVGWQLFKDRNNISLRSGKIEDNSETSIVWQGYFEGNYISFDYRVSSEEGCDEMLFFIDGKGFYQSGETGWRRVKYPIQVGEHKFEWKYRKDGSHSKYEDGAWIDNIKISFK